MTFSKNNTLSWIKNPSHWLPMVQWSGWTLSVFILAKLFWLWTDYLLTPSEIRPLSVRATTVSQSSQKLDVSALLKLDLFGSAQVQAPVNTVEIDAPVTRLKLKLKGIYAADEKGKANAIIEDDRGKQAVYFIDEKLKVAGRVYLRQVYFDKVIIETNGKREALKLDKQSLPGVGLQKTEKKRSNSNKNEILDKRRNNQLTRQVNQVREKLLTDPKSVSDVISGRPHFENGELKGFNISPGKDRRLFQQLGLRRGDLVTAVNGVPLTNMQDAMTLMNDAQSIEELNVEIQRKNETLNLLLNLNEKNSNDKR